MNITRQVPAWAISLIIHGVMILGLMMVSTQLPQEALTFAIETHMLDEDRQQEEFTQTLDQEMEVSENLNFAAAGGVSSVIGGSAAEAAAQTKIDETDIVKDPDVTVNVGAVTIPGEATFTEELGNAEVTGEIGAIVEGYGAALDLMSKELIRLMRSQKLLVVWLFDESESMKDDQEEIKERIGRVYAELNLYQNDEEQKKGRAREPDVLLTSIVSFGEGLNYHMPQRKPSSDISQILQAIDRIPIDRSGTENMSGAIYQVINQYRRAAQAKRKLVLIVVSDESGDDGEFVEDALQAAKSAFAPIYVMGREAVFGSFYAHVNWRHPQTGHIHHVPIRRGPETPDIEQLQFDGLRRRLDAHLSGFGPYEQVRLARDTGGIFFVLPHEEQDINDQDNRKYEAFDMKEYVPNLSSRREYDAERKSSKFRTTIWQVAVLLNPYDPARKDLEIPYESWISLDPSQYPNQVRSRNTRNLATLALMTEGLAALKAVEPLRAREESVRWRAQYDLMVGQLFSYRLRLFQYIIGLDQFAKGLPQRKLNPKSNHWRALVGSNTLLKPDKVQEKLFNVTPEDIDEALASAKDQFEFIQKQHPNTPWEKRAAWELKRGFGVSFQEVYINPNPPKRPPRTTPLAPVPKF